MSRCSISGLIIPHISRLSHPFLFCQFENEAPRVWANNPRKRRKYESFWLFKALLIFLMRKIFGSTCSLMFSFLLENWWGVVGVQSKILHALSCKCWQNLMNLLDGANSCQEKNLIGWNRIDTILNNECVVYIFFSNKNLRFFCHTVFVWFPSPFLLLAEILKRLSSAPKTLTKCNFTFCQSNGTKSNPCNFTWREHVLKIRTYFLTF